MIQDDGTNNHFPLALQMLWRLQSRGKRRRRRRRRRRRSSRGGGETRIDDKLKSKAEWKLSELLKRRGEERGEKEEEEEEEEPISGENWKVKHKNKKRFICCSHC